jgi:hypothetical protein
MDFGPSKETRERIYREGEQRDPELWAKIYPRIYEPTFRADLYGSPKSVARRIMNTVHKVEAGIADESEAHELFWAAKMVQCHLPIYWIAPDLAAAILNTKLPWELPWHDMEMPYDAMTFMLPRNTITHATEGSVQFVSYARCRKMEEFPSLVRDRRGKYLGGKLASENGNFFFLVNTEQEYLTHWCLPYDDYPMINLQDLDNVVGGYENVEFKSGWLQLDLATDDARVAALAAHLIFGLILLMLRKPELIMNSSLIRRIPPKRGDPAKEFWRPGIIGANYKIRRETVHLGGTHASPVGHWVRGFWRDQHHGAGRLLVKEQWIEPYWRGGENEP